MSRTVPFGACSLNVSVDGSSLPAIRELPRHKCRPALGSSSGGPRYGAERLTGGPVRMADRLAVVNRHPWSRLAAWLVDWLLVLGWVAVTAAAGLPLFLGGYVGWLSDLALNVIATLVVVVPVTVGMAVLESSAREASIGKRARRLVVVTVGTSRRISRSRALVRNVLKIALPWTVGHAAVFEITATSTTGAVPVSTWIVTACAYILPIVYVVSLFIGSGRTPYDRISGTTVVVRTSVT